jgi:phage repressor protein C with HTH and peptisase S24 domain
MDKTKMLEGLIRHYTKGNKAQFAKLLGVSAQTISAWIARNTFDAELIYAKCRYVDSSWLLTGEGTMLSPSSAASNSRTSSKSSPSIPTARHAPHGSSEGIPLIPLDAVAGFPAESGGGVRLEDCERYVIPEFENKGANFLIRVSGDSMVPLYYSGDLLACRKITDIRFFQWGTVYVLETSQGVLVKRVQESVDHSDSILCVSENSSVHHPFLLPRDDIRSLSTIVGLVRLV